MRTLFNSSISTNHIWEEYEKAVNDIYLRTVALDIDTFSENDLSVLEDIANQCPLAGGRAVFQARSLYALYNDTLDYVDECEEQGGSAKWDGSDDNTNEKPNAIRQPIFNLYPNPANNDFTFEFKNVDTKSIRVRLFDILGNLLEDVWLKTKDGQHLFRTNKYSASVIIIRAEVEGEMIYNNRVVIMK